MTFSSSTTPLVSEINACLLGETASSQVNSFRTNSNVRDGQAGNIIGTMRPTSDEGTELCIPLPVSPVATLHSNKGVQLLADILKRDTVGEFKQAALDRWRVAKDKQLCAASISCLVVMVTQNLLIWQVAKNKDDPPRHAVNVDRKVDHDLWVAVVAMDIVKALLTLLSLLFLLQYYRVLYTIKKARWLRVIKQTPDLSQKSTIDSLSEQAFARTLAFRFIGEVLIHLILPFEFVSRSSVAYQLLLLGSFMRLYLIFRLLHTSSAAFRRRAQIRSQYQDFRRMNLRVSWGLTIKISFYKYMWVMVSIATVIILFVLAFVIFVFERDEDIGNPVFADLGNCIYFAFITFSTIGYGDMVPKSPPGKGVALLLGVLGHVMSATFGGIVTNKLAPSKTQQLVTEYLENQDAETNYKHAAATLIQSVWRVWGMRRSRRKSQLPAVGAARALGGILDTDRKKHTRQMVFQAVKKFRDRRYLLAKSSLQAIDPVVDQKLDTMAAVLDSHTETLNRLVQAIEGSTLTQSPKNFASVGQRRSSIFGDVGLDAGRRSRRNSIHSPSVPGLNTTFKADSRGASSPDTMGRLRLQNASTEFGPITLTDEDGSPLGNPLERGAFGSGVISSPVEEPHIGSGLNLTVGNLGGTWAGAGLLTATVMSEAHGSTIPLLDDTSAGTVGGKKQHARNGAASGSRRPAEKKRNSLAPTGGGLRDTPVFSPPEMHLTVDKSPSPPAQGQAQRLQTQANNYAALLMRLDSAGDSTQSGGSPAPSPPMLPLDSSSDMSRPLLRSLSSRAQLEPVQPRSPKKAML